MCRARARVCVYGCVCVRVRVGACVRVCVCARMHFIPLTLSLSLPSGQRSCGQSLTGHLVTGHQVTVTFDLTHASYIHALSLLFLFSSSSIPLLLLFFGMRIASGVILSREQRRIASGLILDCQHNDPFYVH